MVRFVYALIGDAIIVAIQSYADDGQVKEVNNEMGTKAIPLLW